MMDNYFGFFSRNPALLDFQQKLAKGLREDAVPDATTAETTRAEDRQLVKDAMSMETPEGVVVSISENPSVGPERIRAPDIFDSMTFEPKEGVLVATDKPKLSDHKDINERISMVEAYTNYAGISSEALLNISEAQKKSEFSLTDILSYAGALEEATRSTVKGVVEVGEFTGNLNNKGLMPEDTVYTSKGESAIGRRTDGSEVNLSFTTSSGNKIDVSVSIIDEFNVQVSEGARRSYEISFEASAELTDEEAADLQSMLRSLDPLINDFKNTMTLNSTHLSSFESMINETSDTFTNVEAEFNYNTIASDKSMTLSIKDDKVQVSSVETNMNSYYQREHYVMNFVSADFGYEGSKGQDYFLSFFES